MRPTQSTHGFRFETLLGRTEASTTFLARAAGVPPRPRVVLKLLGGPVAGPLTGTLRPDILDLASLRHPSLAHPVGFGRDTGSGRPYIARDYVEGAEVSTALKGLAPAKLSSWILQAAEALSRLHRFGLLHRNLKPSNLFVPRTARQSRNVRGPAVVLCDPAWWPEEKAGAWVAAAGTRSDGTTAPEVTAGNPATPAADVYSLGATFYQLLTGTSVLVGESGFPFAPSHMNPEVPTDLERVVMKMVSPDPARRYRDADALVADLKLLRGLRAAAEAPAPECFVGRARDLERAAACLDAGAPESIVAVSGEAGIGKSAFLCRAALEAQLHGFSTARVRCYPEGRSSGHPLRALAEQWVPAGAAGRSLRYRLRQCLEPDAGGPPQWSQVDPMGRRALVRGLIGIIQEALGDRPGAMLLDEVDQADPMALELLAGFAVEVARLSREGPGRRNPLRLFLAFRDESPFRPGLKPLLDALELCGGQVLRLELEALDGAAVGRWLDRVLRGRPEARERAQLSADAGGSPFAVREALRLSGTGPREPGAEAASLASIHREYFSGLGNEEGEILKVLSVLGRPAAAELIAAARRSIGARARSALASLVADGTLSEEGGLYFFQHGSFAAWLNEVLPVREKRLLHGGIAAALAERREGSSEEVARHWLESDAPERGVEPALEAARRLSRSHQDPRALDLYRAVLALIPETEPELRRCVAMETACAYARIGHHRRSIEILEDLLQDAKDEMEIGKLHGLAGISYHRSGDANKAVVHLKKGLARLREAKEAALRERLLIRAELAEIASNRGDYDAAESTCIEAMREIEAAPESSRDPEVRRARMVLLETLAHLRLRRFQYGEARELFEESLRLSKALGTSQERSLILNNLGILYNQESRFQRAIECYEQAEMISSELGEDPILVNIHSNLGILYAKTGMPEQADESSRRAALHDARLDSSRTRFLRLHCAGIVDLYLGRYASAIETLREAITLGEDLKDHFLTAFDLVYLGECHLYRGEMKRALGALDRALTLGSPAPPAVAAMVEARKAALAALAGSTREASAAIDGHAERSAGQVAFLRSWDRVFLGWAHRLLGRWGEAAAELEEARAFFSRARVPAGEIHAALELAALEADRGRTAKARQRLAGLRARYACGQGPLRNPMLAARLLAYHTRVLLDGPEPDVREATASLVESESYLIGRSLRDLEDLVRDLKRRLRSPGSGPRPAPALLPDAPLDPTASLEIARSFKEAAMALARRFEEAMGEDRASGLSRHLRDFDEHIWGLQRAAEGSRPLATPRFRASSILGRSDPARRMIDLIRQIASSRLPVLIAGETGTGKELVARAIHGESPRHAAPFVTLGCAAIPEQLLEAELFGHVRGAFTGAERESPGLLAGARGGTVLFDEIGELPLALQAKLLRVLESGRVRPLGGTEDVEIDVRYIFAASSDLTGMVEEGRFRQDLFFRIRILEVAVPPLRERLEDLPLLVDHFLSLARGEGAAPILEESALRVLASYPWPGNVRELRNVVLKLALTSTEPIRAEQARDVLGHAAAEGLFPCALLRSRPLPQLLAQLERDYLVQLHADRGGDVKAMAATLGVTVQAVYKRLKALGIERRGRGS